MLKRNWLSQILCAVVLLVGAFYISFRTNRPALAGNELEDTSKVFSKAGILSIETVNGKSWVQANQGVIVDVVIDNTTDEKLWYTEIGFSPYIFSVKDSKGKEVPLTRFGAIRLKHNFIKLNQNRVSLNVVQPGNKSKSSKILISQLYDMSVPGLYFITVQMHVTIGKEKNLLKSKPFPIAVIGFNQGDNDDFMSENIFEHMMKERNEKQGKQRSQKKHETQ